MKASLRVSGIVLLLLPAAVATAATPPAPVWTWEPDLAGAGVGSSVSSAGDVNGDGFDDLLVGAREYTDVEAKEGRALVFHGAAEGLVFKLEAAGATRTHMWMPVR